MKTREDLLNELLRQAETPAGPCGRVTFGLWWQQQGEAEAKQLFDGPQLEQIKSIAYDIAMGK